MAADESLILSISADTAQIKRQLKALVGDANQSASGIANAFSKVGNDNRQMAGLSKSFQAAQADAKNLGFQINDLATSLASGGGIMRTFAQQGGQIAQIFSGAGLAQIGRTIVTALVDPFVLIPIALSAAAIAWDTFFSSAEDDPKALAKAQEELNKELERQKQLIHEVAQAWDEAPGILRAIDAYNARLKELEDRRKALLGARRQTVEPIASPLADAAPDIEHLLELFDQIGDRSDSAFGEMADRVKLMADQIAAGGAPIKEIIDFLDQLIPLLRSIPTEQAQELADQMEKLRSKAQTVTPAVTAIDEAMKTLGQDSGQVLKDMLAGFEALLGPLAPLAQLLDDLAKKFGAFPDLGGAFLSGVSQLPQAFRNAVTASGDAARAFLQTKANNAEIAASMENLTDETAKAVAKLFTLLPATARITSAVRSAAKQAQLYADYKAGRGGLAAKHSLHQVGQAVDVGAGVDMETLREAVKMVPELEQLKGRLYEQDKVHVQLQGTSRRQEQEAAQETIKAADAEAAARERLAEKAKQGQQAYEDEIATQQRAIDTQNRHNQIMTDSSLTIDQRTLKVEADTIAQRLNQNAIKNGITLTDDLRARHQALAMSMAQSKAAADNIAASQKALEDAQKKATKAAEDQAKALAKAREQLAQTLASMATSAITGFVQDLRNGVTAAEALYNAVSRIADQLLQMALNAAFMKLFSSLLGVPAGIGAGGGLLGLASGGYTGNRPADQAAGIVHGREFVVNAAATQRHRGLLEAINRGVPGYAAGGFVLPNLGAAMRSSPPPQQASPRVDARVSVVNTFDAGSFLSEALSRPDGVNVILNAVRAQPGAFRQAMQS